MNLQIPWLANVTAASILLILFIRFSPSYFSYAFFLFLIFCSYTFFKCRKKIIPQNIPTGALRLSIIGILTFYAAMLIASILSTDLKNMSKSIELFYLALPFPMMWYLRYFYNVDWGIKLGAILSAFIICFYSFFYQFNVADNRISGFYGQPNDFGSVLYLLILLLFYFALLEKNIWIRLSIGAAIAVCLTALYLTESRGSMLSLSVGIFSAAIILLRTKSITLTVKQRISLLAASLFLIATCITGAYMIQSNRGIQEQALGGERNLMHQASIQIWTDHKLIGIGLTHWQDFYYSPDYHPKTGTERDLPHAHNMTLQILSTTGILGGLGYLSFIVLMALGIYRSSVYLDNKVAFAIITAVFIASTVHGLVDIPQLNRFPARIYFALLGYYFALCHLAKTHKLSTSKK